MFWFWETMYTSRILYLLPYSLFPASSLFIPPHAIISVGVGGVTSRDPLDTSNGLGMTSTLSLWSPGLLIMYPYLTTTYIYICGYIYDKI